MPKIRNPLNLHISPCPNDTFTFCHLLQTSPPTPTSFKIKASFLDIDLLNKKLSSGKTDFCKASFNAWFHEKEHYDLLPVGAALGFNCGPILVGKEKKLENIRSIAVPGLQTTAYLLLQLYLKTPVEIKTVRFDEIMPMVRLGKVDAGLIIHESRFTYKKHGLQKIKDLGEWWFEQTGGLPIPLGGLFCSKRLPKEQRTEFIERLRDSLIWAWKNTAKALAFSRQYAQEMETKVLKQHVKLYVNDFTMKLGDQGMKAIDTLEKMARRKKIL